MPPKTGFRIPSLDGLRAVAIFLVFIGHSDQLPKVIEPSIGVTIFFFLSGYLITTLLRIEWEKHGRIDLRAFYLRRLYRIWPPLYATLIVGGAAILIGIVPGTIGLGGAIASFMHVSNYWLLFGDGGIPAPVKVLWSLAVEEHFYLVFPVLYVLLKKNGLRASRQTIVLGVICGVVLAWRCYLWFGPGTDFDRIYYPTDTRLDSILWGCVFAIILNPVLDRERTWGPAWAWSWLIAPLGAIAVVIGTKGYDLAPTFGYTLQAFGIALVFNAVIRYPEFWAWRWLNWKPTVWLGVVSYSFYLVHKFVILALYDHVNINRWLSAVVAFALTCALAWAMHVWVERPAARMRHRLARSGESTEDGRVASA